MTTEERVGQTKVWDLFIRVFHWSLVVAFTISFITEGEYNIHFYLGWYIGILLSLRILWGLIGTKYARFSDFVKSPSSVIKYAKSVVSSEDNEKTYLGHNPLGGLMVVVMIASLSMTVVTGILLYSAEGNATFDFLDKPAFVEIDEEHEQSYKKMEHERYEYLEENDEYREGSEGYEENEDEELWEEVHEFFANFSILLILLHIAGVVFTSRREKQNLVKAMITGKKNY